ncbi:MAG TPA: FixH family protein [Planctomycetota bacterium]|nr:FixH family protein [Planctomycetota bacterium]
MRRLLTLVLLFGAAGCDQAPAGRGRDVRTFDSNGGKYTIELTTSPSPIATNQPFDVAVTVTPKSGPAADLDVQVDARMPAHFHGMNRVAKVTRGSGNSWKAEGLLFHMPGHWELYVDVTQGGATERAQLDVDLK